VHDNAATNSGHSFDSPVAHKPFHDCHLNIMNVQEEGALDEREALSVGLVGVFERERSLVLSIPAGSRTLREVGRQIHSQRSKKRKKRPTDDEEFFYQVDAAKRPKLLETWRVVCSACSCSQLASASFHSFKADPSFKKVTFLLELTGLRVLQCQP